MQGFGFRGRIMSVSLTRDRVVLIAAPELMPIRVRREIRDQIRTSARIDDGLVG
jgi:hypothetical protein